MMYDFYLNKSVISRRWKDEEALTLDMEGAGSWSMPSKLRGLSCQGPVAGTLVCLRR